MAVQKSKCSRSRRGSRRSQNSKCKFSTLSYNSFSNEIHRRHFVTINGYYKGRKILKYFSKKSK